MASSSRLEKFDISSCDKLTSLGSIHVHSKSLRELSLEGCKSLEEFCVTSENMMKLNLESMPFKELPIGLCLRKLEYLNLLFCGNLTHLPSNFVELTSLRYLKIAFCHKLASLPQLPPSIEQLYATDCSSLESVQFTSTAGDPLYRNMISIELGHCLKLDEHSCNAVELTARLNLRNYAFKAPQEQCKILTPRDRFEPKVVYPGSKVPNWFKYRASKRSYGSEITITPHSKLLGFIFCMIFGSDESLRVDIFLANNGVRFHYTCDSGQSFSFDSDSEHVCIWYERFSEMMNERIEESRSFHNITSNPNPKLSLLFHTDAECWMNPIYANEENIEIT
ncbi:Disease resistance protein RML1A [Senna tora]|uniref:Disease resistance protein RML1A n=1 Tax=Senna tora TaxID=362788 RepID=A0A834TBU9_9FABA|nr:Disease resistance protein RML1A [Senna tora]